MSRYNIKYDLATITGVRYGKATKHVTLEYYIWDSYLEASIKDCSFILINHDDYKSEFFIEQSKDDPNYLELQQECHQLNMDHIRYINQIISYCNG